MWYPKTPGKQPMKKYYEAYDERYRMIHEKGSSWTSSNPTPIVMDTVTKYGIIHDAKVLEIGCGEGRDAFQLLDNGYDILATDISTEAVEYCRKVRPEYADKFAVMNCIEDEISSSFDFIYAVAVVHMLVKDEDRNAFYRFIHDHLNKDGVALICSMGNGVRETAGDADRAFDIVERSHESGPVFVPATTLRMVNSETFENEICRNDLSIIEKGISRTHK